MIPLPAEILNQYRALSFRTAPGKRILNIEQAIAYANELGYLFFWPISGVPFPSLWSAVAGDRPVADAHDDPGHVTWGWKDSLLGKRVWFYAKVLRKRATIISLEALPYFYALSENYGSPEDDHLILYEQGRLTMEEKIVYEVLLTEGPLDAIALRRATRMTSPESDARFNRALTNLQADFKILPVAVTQAGRWRYAFAYDLVPRHYPELLAQAESIKQSQARDYLARLYFRALGAAPRADLLKLFGWRPLDAERAIERLCQSGELAGGVELEGSQGEYFAFSALARTEN
jgi:hypothetical protein